MSFSFLIVLPKLMRSGVAPAASACSISATEAVSKHEPSAREQIENLGRRIGLDRVEHARVRQRAGEAQIILAHDVEIDDETRAVFRRLRARKSLMRSVIAAPPIARLYAALGKQRKGRSTTRARSTEAPSVPEPAVTAGTASTSPVCTSLRWSTHSI